MTRLEHGWERVPIKSVYLSLFDGPHATPKPSSEGPIFLGIGNLREDGGLDLSDIRHISEEEFPRWTRRVLPQPGDIVFTYEATLNRYAIIPDGFRGCLGRRLALIRPNPVKADTRYLYYSFFSADWRDTIEKNKLSGATVDRIPISKLPEFEIALPPLPIQRKIATILSAYDDLIENGVRRIAILEEMVKNLYHEWFVNYRFPGYEATPMIESSLGLVPQGWGVRRLGDVIDLRYGKGLKADQRLPGSVPVYGSSGVVGYHTNSFVPGPGIILGRKGNVGAVHWSDVDFFPIDTVFFVVTDLPMHYVFFNFQNQMFLDSDVAVPGLKREQANSLPFLVPDPGVLEQFQLFAVPIFGQLRVLRAKIANLKVTRDLLLPRLVSGELDVSELDVAGVDDLDGSDTASSRESAALGVPVG